MATWRLSFNDPSMKYIEDQMQAKDAAFWQQTLQARAKPQPVDQKGVQALVQHLAPEYGVDPAFAMAVARTESNYQPGIVSSAGAQGVMQLMPATAKRFGVRDSFDPEQNIRGGLAYLAVLQDMFPGRRDLQAAAYNAGEGAVKKYGSAIPPYPETQEYVKRVLGTAQANAPSLAYQQAKEALSASLGQTTPERETPQSTTPYVPPSRPVVEQFPLPSSAGDTPSAPTSAEASPPAPGASEAQAPMVTPPEALPWTPARKPIEPGLQESPLGAFLGSIGTGMAKSAASLIEAPTTALRMLGVQSEQKSPLEDVADWIREHVAKPVEPRGEQSPLLMQIGEGLGAAASFMVPGAAMETVAGSIVTQAPRIAAALGATTSGVLQGAVAMNDTYQAAKPLVGEEEAAKRARTSFMANTILGAVGSALGVFNAKVPEGLARVVAGAIAQGGQGAMQYDVNRRLFWVPADNAHAQALLEAGWERQGDQIVQPYHMKDQLEAALVNGVVGGVFGAAHELSRLPVPDGLKPLEGDPGFTVERALHAAITPETAPADVPLPLWQRWAKAVLDMLPEPQLGGGGLLGQVLGSERGSISPRRTDLLRQRSRANQRLNALDEGGETAQRVLDDLGVQTPDEAHTQLQQQITDVNAELASLPADAPAQPVPQGQTVSQWLVEQTTGGRQQPVTPTPATEAVASGVPPPAQPAPTLQAGAEGLTPDRYRTEAGRWRIPLKDMPTQELEVQDAIRQPDAQGRWGINLSGETDVPGELRALISPRETGVVGLQNNRNGLTLQQMAERLHEHGFLASADKTALLHVLQRSVTEGHEMHSTYATGHVPLLDNPHVEAAYRNTKDVIDTMEGRTEEQRRGVRPHAQAIGEAQAMLDAGGWTLNDVREIMPGTTMDDTGVAQVVLSMRGLVDSMTAAAQKVIETGGRDPNAIQDYLTIKSQFGAIDAARQGVRAEAGRTLSVLNEPMAGHNRYMDELREVMLTQGNDTVLKMARADVGIQTPEERAATAQQRQRAFEQEWNRPPDWEAMRAEMEQWIAAREAAGEPIPPVQQDFIREAQRAVAEGRWQQWVQEHGAEQPWLAQVLKIYPEQEQLNFLQEARRLRAADSWSAWLQEHGMEHPWLAQMAQSEQLDFLKDTRAVQAALAWERWIQEHGAATPWGPQALRQYPEQAQMDFLQEARRLAAADSWQQWFQDHGAEHPWVAQLAQGEQLNFVQDTRRVAAALAWEQWLQQHGAETPIPHYRAAEHALLLHVPRGTEPSMAARMAETRTMAGERLTPPASGEDLAAAARRETGTAPSAETLTKMQANLGMARPGLAKMWVEQWTAALLGPTSWIRNALGNTAMGIYAFPARLLAEGISPIRQAVSGALGGTPEPGVMPGETAAMLFGLTEGTRQHFQNMARSWQTGESQFGSIGTGKTDVYPKAVTGENMGFAPDSLTAKIIDFWGEYVGFLSGGRTTHRILNSTDELYKSWNASIETAALAHAEARQLGLEGLPYTEQMARVMADPTTAEHIRQGALDFALRQTMQQALPEEGFGRFFGDVANYEFPIPGTEQAIPVGRLLLPFIKIPVNGARFTLENSPIAPLMSSVRADIAAGGRRADIALSRMVLGSLVMASVAGLVGAGAVTGRAPTDPVLREAWLKEHPEYSLRLPNSTWVSYRIDPLGNTIGMVADVAQLMGELTGDTASRAAAAAFSAFNKNIWGQTAAQNLSQFFEAIAPGRGTSAEAVLGNLNRYAKQVVAPVVAIPLSGGLSSSSFARAAVRMTDPDAKNVEGFLDAIYAQTPGWSQEVPRRRTITGEPELYGGGVGPDSLKVLTRGFFPLRMQNEELGPADKAILDNDMQLSRVPPSLAPNAVPAGQQAPVDLETLKTLPNAKLTPAEHERLVVLSALNEQEAKTVYDTTGRVIPPQTMQYATMSAALAGQVAANYQSGQQAPPKPEMSLGEMLDWMTTTKAFQEASPGRGGGKEAAFQAVIQKYREWGKMLFLELEPDIGTRQHETDTLHQMQRLPQEQRGMMKLMLDQGHTAERIGKRQVLGLEPLTVGAP